MELLQRVGYADATALAGNHSSKCILETLETFQVLSTDIHQSRIGETDSFESTGYTLGTVDGER